jgi:hypothetical protein
VDGCGDRRKVGGLQGEVCASFRKPQWSFPKKKPFSHEMHLKILLLNRDLKLLIS